MTATEENNAGEGSMTDTAAAWRRSGLLFVLATVLLFGLFPEAPESMVRIWSTSDTFGFGFLILPIVLFLALQRRRHLAVLAPRPWFFAVIWIVGALLIHLVGVVGNVTLFKQLAFVVLWQGLFALIMGRQVVLQMLFPLCFVLFAVPMGAEAVPFLQTITAEIATFLLRASGVPTFHSGVLIEIPSGAFVVADVCSGARFLITTIVLGALAANLFFTTWWRRIVFMLLCLVVPILANGMRGYGIIMLAHLTDHSLAISVDHIVYGLIFLSFVLFVLTGLAVLFADRHPLDDLTVAQVPQPSVRFSTSLWAFLLASLLLGGGKAWSVQVSTAPATTGREDLAVFQPGDGWQPEEIELAGWQPAFPGADLHLLRTYRAADGEIALFVAHYFYQRDGHEIIAPGNSFVGRGQDRKVTRFEDLQLTVGGESMTIQETLVRFDDGPHLIWSWYDIGGSRTTSPVSGKLLEIWHALSGGSRSATAFALLTPVGDDPAADRARLQGLLGGLAETPSLAASDGGAGS